MKICKCEESYLKSSVEEQEHCERVERTPRAERDHGEARRNKTVRKRTSSSKAITKRTEY